MPTACTSEVPKGSFMLLKFGCTCDSPGGLARTRVPMRGTGWAAACMSHQLPGLALLARDPCFEWQGSQGGDDADPDLKTCPPRWLWEGRGGRSPACRVHLASAVSRAASCLLLGSVVTITPCSCLGVKTKEPRELSPDED